MGDTISWADRFEAARDATPALPSPMGLQPHAHSTLELATALRNIEIAATMLPAESPGWHVAAGVAAMLRETLNARLYAENMRGRLRTQPDRIEALIAAAQALVDRG